jgi:hypothetical protein
MKWMSSVAAVALMVGPALVAAVPLDVAAAAPVTAASLAPKPHDPLGHVDSVDWDPKYNRFWVQGWAADLDVPAAAGRVHLYIDGHAVAAQNTYLPRPDVHKHYPQLGLGTGFAFDVAADSYGRNRHQVCVYGINKGPGHNVLLGCRSISVFITQVNRLIGHIDVVKPVGDGTAVVSGWALDPQDNISPTPFVLVSPDVGEPYDGGMIVEATANLPRPDVDKKYPNNGTRHGFRATITLSQWAGYDEICLGLPAWNNWFQVVGYCHSL